MSLCENRVDVVFDSITMNINADGTVIEVYYGGVVDEENQNDVD